MSYRCRKLNITVKCPKCGREGSVVICIRWNSRECKIHHKVTINGRSAYYMCTVSCIDLEKMIPEINKYFYD